MAVWPSTLDESISAGQSGHISDHQTLHGRWNDTHAKKISSDLTLTSTMSALVVDSAGGQRTLTIPASTDAGLNGWGFVIKRTGTQDVIVNTSPTDTFDDGTSSKTLGSDGAAVGMMSVADGLWYLAGERGQVS